MTLHFRLIPAGAALLVGACSLAPKYQPPAPPQVSQLKEAGDWAPARPADADTRGAWWEAFKDPRLAELEQRLLSANPDLRAAAARFQQARQIAREAGSNLFPTLNANASGTRLRTSAHAPLAALTGGKSSTYDDFLTELSLSWQIDLFGRLRNTLAAARASAQASAADFGGVLLSLEADLATDYFTLRGDDVTIQLLEDAIQQYDRAWQLTSNRYKEGTAAATDVDQAETQRQNARAQLAAVRLQRAQLEHAIAVVVGEIPSNFTLEPGTLVSVPPVIDAGLPSSLLQRRPDVASAERAMAAANAQIGVARAAWFPVFSLASAAGFESTSTGSWLAAPSHFWSLGPSATLPLLDAGGRLAGTRGAQAAFDEATASYRKTTLTAYQEVEDSLAGLHHLADELKADQAAATSAQSSAYHADQRYEAGVADYLEVTTTHTAALNAQRDAISARVALLNSAVSLVRATGGGWSRDQIDHPALP
jgi:NodT family efflux transporter outer membrane factor (OMF) lipoprotein